jgi:hypothetical protein
VLQASAVELVKKMNHLEAKLELQQRVVALVGVTAKCQFSHVYTEDHMTITKWKKNMRKCFVLTLK